MTRGSGGRRGRVLCLGPCGRRTALFPLASDRRGEKGDEGHGLARSFPGASAAALGEASGLLAPHAHAQVGPSATWAPVLPVGRASRQGWQMSSAKSHTAGFRHRGPSLLSQTLPPCPVGAGSSHGRPEALGTAALPQDFI